MRYNTDKEVSPDGETLMPQSLWAPMGFAQGGYVADIKMEKLEKPKMFFNKDNASKPEGFPGGRAILCGLILLQLLWLLAACVRGGHGLSFLILFAVTDVPLAACLLCERIQLRAVSMAVLSAFALNVDLDFPVVDDLAEYDIGMFCEQRLLVPLMIFAFYFMYLHLIRATEGIRASKRGRGIASVLAFFFSLFLLFGYSFQELENWDLVFADSFQMCKSYIFLIGVFFIIYYCIAWVYAVADLSGASKPAEAPELPPGSRDGETLAGAGQGELRGPLGWYVKKVRCHPFLVTFLTLLLFNLPYMITAYPAIFGGDTLDQLLQAFQIPYQSNVGVNLLSQDQLINQHHSVMHTMLMHGFLCLGLKVFHSANAGLFMTALLQTLITFAGMAFLVKTVAAEGASDVMILILEAFYALSPRIQNMLFVLVKDVPYGGVTLISLVLLWKLITGRQCTRATKYYYILCLIILEMLRKEAVYIVIILMTVLIIVLRREWKTWLSCLAAVLLISMLFGRVIYPALDISPASMKEALSIPVQQTARYLQVNPYDVTPEEREAIDRMWDYDWLSKKYDTGISDMAKSTFRFDSTSKDWAAYFGAWFSMMRRHPAIYIQATVSNYYEYFYPGRAFAEPHTFDRRSWDIDYANEMLSDKGVYIHYPECLNGARSLFESVRERLFRMPVLSLFISVACYTWVLLVSFFYWIYRKNRNAALIFLPLFLILLVCLAGPCNGAYFRYYYPVVLCLPASMSLAWVIRGDGRTVGSGRVASIIE